MLILGLDTTGRSYSAALLEDGALLCEITGTALRGQGGLVMETLSMLFGLAKRRPANLDGVAVTTGPGGFTGVRLGVSVAKGICLGLKKPVVAVSSLECLAFQAQSEGVTVWAVLDCLKNEVYAASYVFGPKGQTETHPASVMKPEELAKKLVGPCVLVGDGTLKHRDLLTEKDGATIALNLCHLIRGSSVATLGAGLLPGAKADSADSLAPFYLRQSDARLPEKPLR